MCFIIGSVNNDKHRESDETTPQQMNTGIACDNVVVRPAVIGNRLLDFLLETLRPVNVE